MKRLKLIRSSRTSGTNLVESTLLLPCLAVLHSSEVRETWEENGVGVGVFVMQGFEHRNKESKNTFKRFNNRKGDFNLKNLKQLWDVFNFW